MEQIRVAADQNTEVVIVLGDDGGDDRNIGRISGTVTTDDGEPAVGVEVGLFSDLRGRPDHVARAVTDREGLFYFRIGAGEYHITAVLEGVGVAEDDIVVNAGEDTEVHLVLGEGEIGAEYGVAEDDESLPVSIVLLDVYPNPFNAVASIDFTLPTATNVTLSVFSVNGRLLQTLSNGWQTAGSHQITFNADSYTTGSYMIRLDAGKVTKTQQILLLK